MKKITVSLLLISILTAALTGCGKKEQNDPTSNQSDKKEPIIAMITYSMAEEFGVDVVKGAEEAAKELGAKLVYHDPAGDMQKDISIMEDLITQKVDAICIAPVDANAIIPYIDKAREAGIIIVNWDIETQATVDAKVLTDNYEGGSLGADYLIKKMGTEGKVLVVSDLESVTTTYERNEGFKKRLAETAPNIEIIEQLSSGTRDTHRATVENMLQAHPDIKGIFCADGDRTLGAYVACQANNRTDVLIAGYDATPEQKEIMLKDGPECNMICATDLHPVTLGKVSTEIAFKLINGEKVPEVTLSPIDLMTAEDLNKSK